MLIGSMLLQFISVEIHDALHSCDQGVAPCAQVNLRFHNTVVKQLQQTNKAILKVVTSKGETLRKDVPGANVMTRGRRPKDDITANDALNVAGCDDRRTLTSKPEGPFPRPRCHASVVIDLRLV